MTVAAIHQLFEKSSRVCGTFSGFSMHSQKNASHLFIIFFRCGREQLKLCANLAFNEFAWARIYCCVLRVRVGVGI